MYHTCKQSSRSRKLPLEIALRTLWFRNYPLIHCVISWWRGTVVERRSLAGELSLSCARPAADGWPLTWVITGSAIWWKLRRYTQAWQKAMADYCQVYGVIHFTSPEGWLPVHRDQLRAQRSVTSMGKLYLFIFTLRNRFRRLSSNFPPCFCAQNTDRARTTDFI